MYAKIINGKIAEFPFNLEKLRKANPSKSFPAQPSAELLKEYDIYVVTPTPAPKYDTKTHRVVQSVVGAGDSWSIAWTIQKLDEQQAGDNVRAFRNNLLAACDWTQLADSPLNADAKLAWQLYRETLRMVPQQTDFPWNVEWPPEPGI